MKSLIITLFTIAQIFLLSNCSTPKNEWIELFNGKDLSGWKSNESDESFQVVDGVVIASGPRSHLFYVGDVEKANFKNFELSTDIMTTNTANSGIYFHTKYQDEGWPEVGYEAQVNNSHIGAGDYREVKKTGSLYSVRNLHKAYALDSVWFNMNLRVQGNHVQIRINDILLVDYYEPENPTRYRADNQDRLGSGTFALQCHDPDSEVMYKNFKIKILDEPESVESPDTYTDLLELQSGHYSFTDLHIIADEYFDLNTYKELLYRTGINSGILIDLTESSDTQILDEHISTYTGQPVFIGAKITMPTGDINPALLENKDLDYLLAELDLSTIESTNDLTLYMANYIQALTKTFETGAIDVWANATQLPEELSSEYDQLWTDERMMVVINSAKKNDVAIEINNRLELPSMKFIKLAKANGCRFSCGEIGINDDLPELNYFLLAIEEAKLDYKDIYFPPYKL